MLPYCVQLYCWMTIDARYRSSLCVTETHFGYVTTQNVIDDVFLNWRVATKSREQGTDAAPTDKQKELESSQSLTVTAVPLDGLKQANVCQQPVVSVFESETDRPGPVDQCAGTQDLTDFTYFKAKIKHLSNETAQFLEDRCSPVNGTNSLSMSLRPSLC